MNCDSKLKKFEQNWILDMISMLQHNVNKSSSLPIKPGAYQNHLFSSMFKHKTGIYVELCYRYKTSCIEALLHGEH